MLSRKIDAGSTHTHTRFLFPLPLHSTSRWSNHTIDLLARIIRQSSNHTLTLAHKPTGNMSESIWHMWNEKKEIIIERKSFHTHTHRMPKRTKYDGLQHFYQRRALIQPGSMMRCDTHITTFTRRQYTRLAIITVFNDCLLNALAANTQSVNFSCPPRLFHCRMHEAKNTKWKSVSCARCKCNFVFVVRCHSLPSTVSLIRSLTSFLSLPRPFFHSPPALFSHEHSLYNN